MLPSGSFLLSPLPPAEEMDEDEDDENSEESVEDESDEDLTETPKTSSTQPPYSLIPPPPVWVQRNQGLSTITVFHLRVKDNDHSRLHTETCKTAWREIIWLDVSFLSLCFFYFQCGAGSS